VRRHSRIVLTTVVAAMLAMVPIAASASSAVLTSGGRGSDGLEVEPGAHLEASATGDVTFASTSSDTGDVTCSASTIDATVLTNPVAPGTAGLSVTGFSFSGCKSTIRGTTGVERITFDDLPYKLSISDATSPPTETLRPGDSGPIQLTVELRTSSGPIGCVYRPHASSINTAVTADGVTFEVALDGAPSPEIATEPCRHIGGDAGSYGPFLDLGNLQRVFVN
jgi:hypothetical protein